MSWVIGRIIKIKYMTYKELQILLNAEFLSVENLDSEMASEDYDYIIDKIKDWQKPA